MKMEFGKYFKGVRDRAGEMAHTGMDRAKVAAEKAKTEAKARVTKAVDGNVRLSAIREKTNKFKAQTHDKLIRVRETIATVKSDPKGAISTATSSIKTQATKAKDAVETRAAETQANITQRAVGIFARALFDYVRDPQSFEDVRTQLSVSLPNKIRTHATAINSDGLSPQHLLQQNLGVDQMNGVRVPLTEGLIYSSDRTIVFLGWLTTQALNKYLRLSGEDVIQPAHVNSIVTSDIVAPSIQFAGRTAGTIYQHAHDAFQSRFSSGPTSPTTS